MNINRAFWLITAVSLGTTLASASGITYTCDSGLVNDGTCAVLNSTISGLYASTFTNANATIYIRYGTAGLASSSQFDTNVTYTQYADALAAHEGDANDAIAVASLGGDIINPADSSSGVGESGVGLTSALATALGLTTQAGSSGTTIAGGPCTLGTLGCYNGIETVTDAANTWFYRSGAQGAGTFDIYSAIEHETDEVLGTISCISGPGTSYCANGSNVGLPGPVIAAGAADLFRYAAPGTRSYIRTANGSTAYFSINGGVTDVADYNNSPNGADYGDWDSASLRVQNAYGTPNAANFDITNDGRSEIAVLDAVGYNLANPIPEPGTIALLGSGLTLLAGLRYRRRR